MTALNIANVSNIYSKTAFLAATTANQTILTNSSSGHLLRATTLIVTNVNGGASANVTVSIVRGGSVWYLAFIIVVPASSSLVVISKDTPINLEENDYIVVTASVNSYLLATLCYEDMS